MSSAARDRELAARPTLEERDAELSRCGACREWRWRASYLPCQACQAPPDLLRARRLGRELEQADPPTETQEIAS